MRPLIRHSHLLDTPGKQADRKKLEGTNTATDHDSDPVELH